MARQKEEPIEVVDLDTAVEAEHVEPGEAPQGQSFWFAHIGVIKLPNGSQYHASRHRAVISNPDLIEQLKQAAQNPNNSIFIE